MSIPENICGLCYHDKSESKTCNQPDCEANKVEEIVITDKHPDLIKWEEAHNKPLLIGSKVKILETAEYFDAHYDTGRVLTVVMMYVDSGGLCMGLNDGLSDTYLCETDGYYIKDLEPITE